MTPAVVGSEHDLLLKPLLDDRSSAAAGGDATPVATRPAAAEPVPYAPRIRRES